MWLFFVEVFYLVHYSNHMMFASNQNQTENRFWNCGRSLLVCFWILKNYHSMFCIVWNLKKLTVNILIVKNATRKSYIYKKNKIKNEWGNQVVKINLKFGFLNVGLLIDFKLFNLIFKIYISINLLFIFLAQNLNGNQLHFVNIYNH